MPCVFYPDVQFLSLLGDVHRYGPPAPGMFDGIDQEVGEGPVEEAAVSGDLRQVGCKVEANLFIFCMGRDFDLSGGCRSDLLDIQRFEV